MALTKLQKFGAAASLSLAAVFGAAQADAMELGCRNADIVRAELQAEGQFVLVSGERTSDNRPRNIFTSNESGTLGYNVEAGTGRNADKLCVAVKYTDVKVNTDPNLSRPSWASFDTNSGHNQWLTSQEERNNARVFLGATALVRQANGSDARGAFFMVTATDRLAHTISDNIKSGGAITATSSQGTSALLAALVNVDRVQPNYDAFAHRPQQTASLQR